jgi:hypothetical protein
MGYQPRNNFIKDKNGDLLANSHNIMNTWKNYYSQLLNVHRVCDIRQMEIYTAEPSPSEVETALQSWKV